MSADSREPKPTAIVDDAAAELLGVPFVAQCLMRTVSDAVAVIDEERRIVAANPRFMGLVGDLGGPELLFGLRPGEALGCRHADGTSPQCGTGASCRFCGTMQAMAAALPGETTVRECRIPRPGNAVPPTLDLEVRATRFEHEGNEYVILAMRDLADEKRREALERTFLHDLMNTVGVLVGLAERLEFLGPEAVADDDSFGVLLSRASGRLIDEIQGQRELLAAERGELAVKAGAVEPAEVIARVVQLYRHHTLARKRHIDVQSPLPVGEITTGRGLLERILGNMMKNALEASQPDDTVRIGCKDEQDNLNFWVQNPQVMPRDVQLQLFQRSFSTKGPGRGLGTYAMKLLGERYLHGEVTFFSEPGKGTRFSVRLPRRWSVSHH